MGKFTDELRADAEYVDETRPWPENYKKAADMIDDLERALRELLSEDWAHYDDEEIQEELERGNEMVRSHIAGRNALNKLNGA